MNIEPKSPAKIWTDPEGFCIAEVDKICKSEPEKYTRVFDMKEADVCYMDSEVFHFWEMDQVDKNPDQYYNVKKGTCGIYNPQYTRIDPKKRVWLSYAFANKLFDNAYPHHPYCYNLPEEWDQLKSYMSETGNAVICKPTDGGCGDGIVVITHPDDMEKKLDKKAEYACQIYLNNPLTFGKTGRKIDYRVSFCQLSGAIEENTAFFQTQHQGRIAPEPYQPATRDNQDNIKSHITFFPELFEDPKLYIISDSCEKYHESAIFQHWNAIRDFYENEKKIIDFDEKFQKKFKEVVLGLNVVLAPYMKYYEELRGRELIEAYDYIFTNFIGTDLCIDEDFNVHIFEFNITPSCGDYNEAHNTGGNINPVFQQWGREAVKIWLELGSDREGTMNKDKVGTYEKLFGKDKPHPEQDRIDLLRKVFNLYLRLTTGSSKLMPFDSEDPKKERFPEKMDKDFTINELASICNISKERQEEIWDKNVKNESGFYLLVSMQLSDDFSKEEIIKLLKQC